jgi:Ribosome-associated heat shock protein implicated in the recycling of the 50S subunit (S4 paralog)
MDNVRIDKYLWAIRVFKTRSDATDACNGGKVKLAGVNAKPSKAVKAGDVLEIRKGPALFSYRILKVTGSRMGAVLVPKYAEDLTPDSERAKLQAPRETLVLQRDRGAGRPTKRDRRQLEEALEALDFDE